MQCQTCNAAKLSAEFFAEPLSPNCVDHINLNCNTCILKKLGTKCQCPTCGAPVAKDVVAKITSVQKAFQVPVDFSKPVAVQGCGGPVTVIVMGLDGSQFSLNMVGTNTVKELRAAIGQRINHAADKLILHCNNDTLKVSDLHLL